MKVIPYVGAVAVSMLACSAQAACPPDAEITAIVARYAAREAVPNPPSDMTMEVAACGRDKFIAALKQKYGRHVGYKAALTNPAVQKALNYLNPIRGILSETMLADGTELPATFGARPLFEADMVMEVKDATINQATTHLEALGGISRIYRFIELPNLMVEDPSKLTALSFLFLNAGARHGVLGKPLVVTATPELVEALVNMTRIVEIEPLLFRVVSGGLSLRTDRIAFGAGESGEVDRMFPMPEMVLHKLVWYDTVLFQRWLLGFLLVVFAAAALGASRRLVTRRNDSPLVRWRYRATAGLGLVNIAFAVGFGSMLLRSMDTDLISESVFYLLFLPLMSAALKLCVVSLVAWEWKQRAGAPEARIRGAFVGDPSCVRSIEPPKRQESK